MALALGLHFAPSSSSSSHPHAHVLHGIDELFQNAENDTQHWAFLGSGLVMLQTISHVATATVTAGKPLGSGDSVGVTRIGGEHS